MNVLYYQDFYNELLLDPKLEFELLRREGP